MPIYMNYNSIPGDVTETGHSTWIELDSFSWGMGRGISTSVGSGAERESSAPSVSEVVVTKQNDVASGKLLVEAFTGEGETVQIDFCRTNKDKLDVYLTVTLTNTIISGYSLASGADRPTETISLNFTKVLVSTKQMAADGSDAQPDRLLYDLTTAKTG